MIRYVPLFFHLTARQALSSTPMQQGRFSLSISFFDNARHVEDSVHEQNLARDSPKIRRRSNSTLPIILPGKFNRTLFFSLFLEKQWKNKTIIGIMKSCLFLKKTGFVEHLWRLLHSLRPLSKEHFVFRYVLRHGTWSFSLLHQSSRIRTH